MCPSLESNHFVYDLNRPCPLEAITQKGPLNMQKEGLLILFQKLSNVGYGALLAEHQLELTEHQLKCVL